MLRRRWFKIAIDTALLVGFVTAFVSREGPDYGFHSWVGIVLVPVISAHLVSNAGWIRRVVARGRDDREFPLAVLNTGLGLLASVCITTGFPVWLEWSENELWAVAHTITGFLSIIVMFVHLWRNRSRIRQLAVR